MRNFVLPGRIVSSSFQNSGINEVVVDVALEAKRQNLPVIAVVSLGHCRATPAAHSSG